MEAGDSGKGSFRMMEREMRRGWPSRPVAKDIHQEATTNIFESLIYVGTLLDTLYALSPLM